ncbi:MAG: DUF4430 domain-containing protein [Candidatus Odinarchaeota archaeon]
MKNIKKIVYFFGALIFIQLLYAGSIPIVKAQGESTNSYFQDLDYTNPYVYEVIQFGDPAGWYNFSAWPNSYEGNWKSNSSGQIRINFNGFYDKDPNDWGNVFGDPIPWYDIEIYENSLGTLNLNFTLSNRSNSEVARALTIGYNNFQPGFLIPNGNLTNVKELALNQSDPGGLYDIVGEVDIEESYNFLYIDFEQNDGGQKTSLIYDRFSGLLVWAKTNIFGYLLEINSLNFTKEDSFIYNVIQFSGDTGWYNLTGGFEGNWSTSSEGQIIANLTGYYNKDPYDWGNVIDDPIPWFNVEIIENETGILTTIFTIANRSNSEIGWSFILGFNYFQPGFILHIIDNLTRVKKLAIQESSGFANGLVLISETPLTMKISFEQTDGNGDQETSMIYEKQTGILLWAYTSIGDYSLEIKLDDYIPWESTETDIRPGLNFFLDIFPYILVALISILIITTSLIVSRFKTDLKKYNKYILVAIIAVASFTSFFIFSSSIKVSEVNEPLREVNDLTLIVDYGNGTETTWESFDLTNYNTTAFDALSRWCKVEITDYGERGIIVESINGLKKGWLYTVNDKSPGVSAEKYNLKDGDIVKWTCN